MSRSRAETFRIIAAALALAEERTSLPLQEVATAVGVGRDELRQLLDPVLFLEFRTSDGDLVTESRAFLLTEDDRLAVDEHHWLRDLAARPPGPDHALRLFVAGTVFTSMYEREYPHLERALRRLAGIVDTDVVVGLEVPPCQGVADEACRARRTLRFRYTDDRGVVSEREVEPWNVFSEWGRWYVLGCDVASRAERWFRVDRMTEAELGSGTFEPPVTEVPERFDLSEHARTLRIRFRPEDLDALSVLTTPLEISPGRSCPDGRVEVDVTVFGDQRLRHLLVTLPAEAEVEPPEVARLRREHAAEILALYRTA